MYGKGREQVLYLLTAVQASIISAELMPLGFGVIQILLLGKFGFQSIKGWIKNDLSSVDGSVALAE